jgi:hypothetical protein
VTRPEQPKPYPGDDPVRVTQPVARSTPDNESDDIKVAVDERPPQPEPYPGDTPPHLRVTQESSSTYVYPRVFRSFR